MSRRTLMLRLFPRLVRRSTQATSIQRRGLAYNRNAGNGRNGKRGDHGGQPRAGSQNRDQQRNNAAATNAQRDGGRNPQERSPSEKMRARAQQHAPPAPPARSQGESTTAGGSIFGGATPTQEHSASTPEAFDGGGRDRRIGVRDIPPVSQSQGAEKNALPWSSPPGDRDPAATTRSAQRTAGPGPSVPPPSAMGGGAGPTGQPPADQDHLSALLSQLTHRSTSSSDNNAPKAYPPPGMRANNDSTAGQPGPPGAAGGGAAAGAPVPPRPPSHQAAMDSLLQTINELRPNSNQNSSGRPHHQQGYDHRPSYGRVGYSQPPGPPGSTPPFGAPPPNDTRGYPMPPTNRTGPPFTPPFGNQSFVPAPPRMGQMHQQGSYPAYLDEETRMKLAQRAKRAARRAEEEARAAEWEKEQMAERGVAVMDAIINPSISTGMGLHTDQDVGAEFAADSKPEDTGPEPFRLHRYQSLLKISSHTGASVDMVKALARDLGVQNPTRATRIPADMAELLLTELDHDCLPVTEDLSVALPRPPVVCVMGHVDHGKTTLLDALRYADRASEEAGGITQALGAFKVPLSIGRDIAAGTVPLASQLGEVKSTGKRRDEPVESEDSPEKAAREARRQAMRLLRQRQEEECPSFGPILDLLRAGQDPSTIPGVNSGVYASSATFLDTPGHALFHQMRRTGVQCTDVVLLVVSSVDGVLPQTVESIRLAQSYGLPMIVVCSKVDLPGADPARVRRQLSQYDVHCEEPGGGGGDVLCVETNALTGLGIDALCEAIAMQAELSEVQAAVDGPTRGICLESQHVPGAGFAVDILCREGTVHHGDIIMCGGEWARVKGLLNEWNEPVSVLGPSDMGRVLGFQSLSDLGEGGGVMIGGEWEVVPSKAYALRLQQEMKREHRFEVEARLDESAERDAAEKEEKAAPVETGPRRRRRRGGNHVHGHNMVGGGSRSLGMRKGIYVDPETGITNLNVPLWVRADMNGSLEALLSYLNALPDVPAQLQQHRRYQAAKKARREGVGSLSPTEEAQERLCMRVNTILVSTGVGPPTVKDLEEAADAGGLLLCFNLSLGRTIQNKCEQLGVEMAENEVIYRLMDRVVEYISTSLPALPMRKTSAVALVQQVFKTSKKKKKARGEVGPPSFKQVAGVLVSEGTVAAADHCRVVRRRLDEETGDHVESILYDGRIVRLQHFQDRVSSLIKGKEGGVLLEDFDEFEEGDELHFYTLTELPQEIEDSYARMGIKLALSADSQAAMTRQLSREQKVVEEAAEHVSRHGDLSGLDREALSVLTGMTQQEKFRPKRTSGMDRATDKWAAREAANNQVTLSTGHTVTVEGWYAMPDSIKRKVRRKMEAVAAADPAQLVEFTAGRKRRRRAAAKSSSTAQDADDSDIMGVVGGTGATQSSGSAASEEGDDEIAALIAEMGDDLDEDDLALLEEMKAEQAAAKAAAAAEEQDGGDGATADNIFPELNESKAKNPARGGRRRKKNKLQAQMAMFEQVHGGDEADSAPAPAGFGAGAGVAGAGSESVLSGRKVTDLTVEDVLEARKRMRSTINIEQELTVTSASPGAGTGLHGAEKGMANEEVGRIGTTIDSQALQQELLDMVKSHTDVLLGDRGVKR